MAGSARVFISYSSKDTDIVDHLKAALADAGVSVWLDHEQLTPGTPNWEHKVREGIVQATHVVYAASPDAAASPFVIHEIEMARGNGKIVLPFWIRGDQWYDCAPMGWYRAQYTDGRDTAQAEGLRVLLAALTGTVAPASPSVPASARPIETPPTPAYPLPDVPSRLIDLGFRGINPTGTPAVIPPVVSVPAGPFLMGTDLRRVSSILKDERHHVELADFQIGKYPVTVFEYALAVRAGAVRQPTTLTGVSWQRQIQRLDHPVVCVSWQDAQDYVTWLRKVTGDPGWRLPSEAQWEKAARWDPRANESRIYPWGDAFDKNRCNTAASGIKSTTPVGSYPANDSQRSGASPCGAEDMAGNVWEWTSSLFRSYPYDASDGRESLEPTGKRTLRGGSWGGYTQYAEATWRNYNEVDFRGSYDGFRLAMSAPTGS